MSLGNYDKQHPWVLSSNPHNLLHFPGVSAQWFYLVIHMMVFFFADLWSLQETLRKADEIFGVDNKDLYIAFDGLLSRHLPS